jgi:coiled-coil domain-containing protein 6
VQQAKAEQEEEFISNTLLKEIHSLKKEKERLAMNYEQEEEYLTNDLSRKLFKVSQSKDEQRERGSGICQLMFIALTRQIV